MLNVIKKNLLFFVGICSSVFGEPLNLSISAKAAILMNADNGAILFEKNMHQPMFPASITKIATALFVLKHQPHHVDHTTIVQREALISVSAKKKQSATYAFPPYWLEPDGTNIGLKEGEVVLIGDLLYGMMLASGNDAANVIAEHVGGSIPTFIEQLNLYVKKLGCRNTEFYNPHGLFHPQQQTTAYDMALIAREALKDPMFCQIVSTKQYRCSTRSSSFIQSNKLLKKGAYYYPDAIGIKTGYLSASKHNLVAAARRNGRTLIAVFLKTQIRNDMFADAIKLFEAAFNEKKVERVFFKAGPQPYQLSLSGQEGVVRTVLAENLSLSFFPSEEPTVKCFVRWHKVKVPILKDQKVGDLFIATKDGHHVLAKGALLAATELMEKKAPANISLHVLKWIGIVLGFMLLIKYLRRG